MRIVHKGGGPVQGVGEELLADGGVGGDDIQLNELQGGLAFQRVEPVYHCPVVSPLSKFCLLFQLRIYIAAIAIAPPVKHILNLKI